MQMTGDYRIGATREVVWAALNDPEVLRRAFPGCESLDKTSSTAFEARLKSAVGPVSVRFATLITLSDIDPPNSYTLSGEGKGGAAGSAKGSAKVWLAEDGQGTVLSYEVEVKVVGKLAQLGSRLINVTAKKMAEDFFGRFSELVVAPAPAEPVAPVPVSRPLILRPAVWVAGLIVLGLLVLAVLALGMGGA